MASGFAYALAGGLKGFGEGIVAQAQAEREASRERIRQMFQREERIAGQEFTLERDEASRGFQTSERIAQQEFTAGQNAASRAASAARETQGESIVLEDGTLGVRRGTTVTRVLDEEGNPVKAGQKPVEGKIITLDDGTTGTLRGDVFTPATTTTGDPVRSRVPKDGVNQGTWNVQFRAELRNLDDDVEWMNVSPEERRAEALRRTEEVMGPNPSGGGGRIAPADAPAAAPANPRDPSALPQPKSREEFEALPKGARFIDPNGMIRVK